MTLHCPRLLTVVLFLVPGARISAHGLPIDVLANSVTGQLFALESFEPGELTLTAGVEISADAPGIGVSFPSNGLAPGTPLGVDLTQQLLYWNGTELAEPAVSLWLDNPAQSASYTVSATTGEQKGMSWATYPGGSFWDAHGLYTLDSLAAPAGIYGLATRITSPNYSSSKPFLLPLIYDPSGEWTPGELDIGIELLRAAVVAPASADFDNDNDVDGVDFLDWQRGFGPANLTTTPADGDADLDSDVDRYDLAFWQSQFGTSTSQASFTNIPEPPGLVLMCLALLTPCRLWHSEF